MIGYQALFLSLLSMSSSFTLYNPATSPHKYDPHHSLAEVKHTHPVPFTSFFISPSLSFPVVSLVSIYAPFLPHLLCPASSPCSDCERSKHELSQTSSTGSSWCSRINDASPSTCSEASAGVWSVWGDVWQAGGILARISYFFLENKRVRDLPGLKSL